MRLSDFVGASVQAPKALEAIRNPDCGWFYRRDAETFKQIPGTPIAYWASDGLLGNFEKGELLAHFCDLKQGIITGDNDRFLRLWFEVSNSKAFIKEGSKWFPHNKGGEFRRWYGNREYLINWENNGYEIINYRDDSGKQLSRPQNLNYQFRDSISWSLITSGRFAARRYDEAFTFNVAGMSCFPSEEKLPVILGFMNSSAASVITSLINPTLNMNAGDVAKLPIAAQMFDVPAVSVIVDELSGISRTDYDSFETSWDFKRHPLV